MTDSRRNSSHVDVDGVFERDSASGLRIIRVAEGGNVKASFEAMPPDALNAVTYAAGMQGPWIIFLGSLLKKSPSRRPPRPGRQWGGPPSALPGIPARVLQVKGEYGLRVPRPGRYGWVSSRRLRWSMSARRSSSVRRAPFSRIRSIVRSQPARSNRFVLIRSWL